MRKGLGKIFRPQYERIRRTQELEKKGSKGYEYRVLTKEKLVKVDDICKICNTSHENPDGTWAGPDGPRRKAVRWYHGHGVISIIQRRPCLKTYSLSKRITPQGVNPINVHKDPLKETWINWEIIDENKYEKYKNRYI